MNFFPLLRADGAPSAPAGVEVDDVHARLNATRVRSVAKVNDAGELPAVVRAARAAGLAISVAGGRHAMGGQQFGAGTLLVDTTGMRKVLGLDRVRGIVEVEAGIQWPELVDYLVQAGQEGEPAWGITQKQTGADRLSLGGALAANAHGRGLRFAPIVADVEAFTLVDAAGELRACSRDVNPELFRLAIGGYGLFGLIATVRLRLSPRRKVRRLAEIATADQLQEGFARRLAEGCLYGDFQFAIDPASDDFLRRGVFACYQPVPEDMPVQPGQKELSDEDWQGLILLAHADKTAAYQRYVEHYLATSGQVYWSDTHQLTPYFDGYHQALDARTPGQPAATEMITELYVPRPRLADFLEAVAADAREHGMDIIYGTVRLIERDDETFLSWAREPWACTVFNLHVVHSPAGIEKAGRDFRRLIDRAIERGGSYFLTYHRWAERRQVEACYPQFAKFLRHKLRCDPEERFQSDWYRHHKALFA